MSPQATATPNAPDAQAKADDALPRCTSQVNTSKGYKACIKPAGHDTEGSPLMERHGKGHASRKYAGRMEYKEPSKSVIASLDDVPDDDEVEYGAGRPAAERSELQRKVDGIVADAHKAWVEAGKPEPSNFNNLPRKRFFVTPDDEAAVRAMLHSAGRFNGVSIRMPSVLKKHENGKFMLYFAATDRRERSASAESAGTAENSGASS